MCDTSVLKWQYVWQQGHFNVFKSQRGEGTSSIHRQRLPFIFDTWWGSPDSSWGAVRPIMHVGPPSRDTISSTVMIVTSSLPFQLDAQFHPRVPRESQPHHPRLESPNRRPPPRTCSWTLLSVSIQYCLFSVIEEYVTEQRTMRSC